MFGKPRDETALIDGLRTCIADYPPLNWSTLSPINYDDPSCVNERKRGCVSREKVGNEAGGMS